MRATSGPLVAGVVLAAGRSQRFGGGRSKLLAELDGEALVRRVVLAALGSCLKQVLIVLGHAAAEVRLALAGLDVEWAPNPDYAQGQSTSVRAGLGRVASTMEAALFLPGDQPLISSRLIDRLVEAHRVSGQPVVRPRVGGRPGAPVLWHRSLFSELETLAGDSGGRQLLKGRTDMLEVEIEDPLEIADVDTISDLQRLTAPQR